jgi:transposase
MATGWRPGPPRLLNPDQEKQVVAWRDKGLTARQIVEEVRNAWDIKVSQRTVKNTYDRMKRK